MKWHIREVTTDGPAVNQTQAETSAKLSAGGITGLQLGA